jgi:dimethylargininase
MLIAITRSVSPSLAECELTHRAREPIDVRRAVEQHAAYERTLASLGAGIVRVPGDPELPDAVFIEDTALVLDEVAVITRPGAVSRRLETGPVARELATYRPLLHLEAPATMDGGDVLGVGRTLYVGLSSRTNQEALRQLSAGVGPFGYRVVPLELGGCLHLKSAVTRVGEGTVLLNPRWVSAAAFGDLEVLCVAPAEPEGANALTLGDTLVYPLHFPRTAERLLAHGFRVTSVECTELAKAEGGVTCCSLVFHAAGSTA